MTNECGVKTKNRQSEPLCFCYFQYLYQQLHSENEMEIAFLNEFCFALLTALTKIVSMLAPNHFLLVNILKKIIQLQYDETQIIDEKTGN